MWPTTHRSCSSRSRAPDALATWARIGLATCIVVSSTAHAAHTAVPAQDSDVPILRRLSPAQMEEDLFALTEELASQHGGLLRYTRQEEMDAAFGELLYETSEERSVLEFYRLVCGLIASIGCGHTGVSLPALDATAALAARGLLPLEIFLRGERAYVRRALGEGVLAPPGTEILSIDGKEIGAIRRIAFSRMSADGFIETGRERELEEDFAELYGLLVDDVRTGPFRLRLAGTPGMLELDGLPRDRHAQARTASTSRPVMTLELHEDESLALLAISTFGDPGGGEPSFPEQLEDSIQRVRAAGIENLVLDLRGNGGGRDMYGALVVSYLSPKPFRYFERIEVTDAYEGQGETRREAGRRLMLSHPGLQLQQPAAGRFTGTVFVLTDGWTFSTAADVATVAHHLQLATFVGEETGGGYDGNTSGVSSGIQLPHSGLSVNVPRWMYTTANLGHAYLGRGVPPDHFVPGTIAQALSGADAQLDFVRQLLARD